MNRKSRQEATSPVERDFLKLLNTSYFGIDCRNSIDNYILEPIYDDLGEIAYIEKQYVQRFCFTRTLERKNYDFLKKK